MGKYFSIKFLLQLSLISFFILPFIIILTISSDNWEISNPLQVMNVLKNTFYQSCLSAFFSLLLALLAAQSIIFFKRTYLKKKSLLTMIEGIYLVPNIIPSIFILLAYLKILQDFPFGLIGIIIIHVAINTGLTALILAQIMENKLGPLAEIAIIEGSGKFFFFKEVILKYLFKDLLLLFFFLFSIFFSSFAVPLLVGANYLTLEVFIFQKIQSSNTWGEAQFLIIIEFIFLLILSLFFSTKIPPSKNISQNLGLIENKWGFVIPLIFTALIIVGLTIDILPGIKQFQSLITIITWKEFLKLSLGSIIISLSCGFSVLFMFLIITYNFSNKLIQKFLLGYSAPSSIIIGFAFLILGPNFSIFPFIKVILALTIIITPLLYRLYWINILNSLSNQISIALILGANNFQIFRYIIIPQVIKPLFHIAGLSAFWGAGDFALSEVISGKNISLAMLIEKLMSNYRLDSASIIAIVLIFIGLTIFYFFILIGRYLSFKMKSVMLEYT